MPAPSLEMVIAHEDRIQHLEEVVPVLSASVARVEVQISEQQRALQAMNAGVTDKLCDLETVMKEHAMASAAGNQRILERLVPIETEKHKSDARWALAKKAVLPVSVVLTAALVKFGEQLWVWLSG